MSALRKYRRRDNTPVAAVQLALDTDGFSYRKWGAEQRCKPGDWLVESGDEIYTVDSRTFARTYRRVGLGVYEKVAPVWARRAESAGVIATLEGPTHHAAGDYLVYQERAARAGWAIDAQRFAELYEPADSARDDSAS
jgi:hypothetical protein